MVIMNKSLLNKARRLIALTRPTEIRVTRQQCPLCHGPYLIRLRNTEHGIRCLSCRASPAQMSIAKVIRDHVPELSRQDTYELSSRGALHGFLAKESGTLTCSEFFDDTPPGKWLNGVQCQNVEKLTYQSASFDLCTSTDVFEHVVEDSRGFAEISRVLRSGGTMIFTVPLTSNEETLERAVYREGTLIHLEEPEYHDDHLRGASQVLCFRTYGRDIIQRLTRAGFAHAEIDSSCVGMFMGHGRSVLVAHR